jgi:negative regulator of flagellin synthesis FlgM
MSSINGIGNNPRITQVVHQPVHKQLPAGAAPPPARSAVVDKLELSGVSHLLKTLKSNDVRLDKVAEIRAQIEAGTYETDEKLDIAADRLLDDLQSTEVANPRRAT